MTDDDRNLREPRELTRLQDIDLWSLAGVAALCLGAFGMAAALAWVAAKALS